MTHLVIGQGSFRRARDRSPSPSPYLRHKSVPSMSASPALTPRTPRKSFIDVRLASKFKKNKNILKLIYRMLTCKVLRAATVQVIQTIVVQQTLLVIPSFPWVEVDPKRSPKR